MSVLKEIKVERIVNTFKDLIRINTTNPTGNEIEAIEFLQDILQKEGIESEIHMSSPNRANIIAKLEGKKNNNNPPLIFISHVDVVGVIEEDWLYDPFAAEEIDGVIYGRGTLDTKQLTVMELYSFLHLNKYKDQLNRDVYFIATADEEQGSHFGMKYLTEQFPMLIPTGLVINEGGGFYLPFKGKDYMLITVGEKGSSKVILRSEGESGHAACPPKNSAMGRMASAIKLLTEYKFPIEKSKISDHFLEILNLDPSVFSELFEYSDSEDDQTVKKLVEYILYNEMYINEVDIGERINVIPYKAEVEIEFRLLPHLTKDRLEVLLNAILANTEVTWEIQSFEPGFESEWSNELTIIFQKKIIENGFEATLLPIYALGRTDGRFLGDKGSDVYGFSPLLPDLTFADVLSKVHQNNECISIKSLLFGTEVLTQSVSELCMNQKRGET